MVVNPIRGNGIKKAVILLIRLLSAVKMENPKFAV